MSLTGVIVDFSQEVFLLPSWIYRYPGYSGYLPTNNGILFPTGIGSTLDLPPHPVPSGKLTQLAGISLFLIGNTSSKGPFSSQLC